MGFQVGVFFKIFICVFFDLKGEFVVFGIDVEDKYIELVLNEEYYDWYFFRWFKMMLYNNQVLILYFILV